MTALVPRPIEVLGARGEAYESVPDALEAWVEARTVPDAAPLASPLAFRSGAYFVKFYEKGGSPLSLRRSPARRSAAQHARLVWIPVPRPVCALDLPPGGTRTGVLVTHFIDGVTAEVSLGEPGALDELAELLARMHSRGIHHGDLHPRNLIWDGSSWWLLDLDGIRAPLHRVYGRRLALRQWGRLGFNLGDPEVLRGAFERYARARGPRFDATRGWGSVLSYCEELRRKRAAQGRLP